MTESDDGRLPMSAIDPHALTPDERIEWLDELDRYQRTCGCDTGAIGACCAALLLVAWQAATVATLTLGAALVGMIELTGAAVTGGLMGKLYGLARARSRFRRVTARLIAQHQRDRGHVEMHPVG
jgi:hypothetical protein